MALSEYRFSARGVTGADTLVGQATADLTVRKDFFVDLKVPAALTQGDKPRFSAEVHHVGVKGNVESEAGDLRRASRSRSTRRRSTSRPTASRRSSSSRSRSPTARSVRLTLTAKAGEASDELVVEVPIRPWGVQAFASASGTSSDDATVFVGLPPGRAYESPEMRVDVSPTLRRLLIELALGRDFSPLARERPASAGRSRRTPSPTAPPTCSRRPRPWPTSARPGRRTRPRPPGWPTGSRGSWPSWSPTRTTTAAGRGSPPRRASPGRGQRPADLGARGVCALASAEPLGPPDRPSSGSTRPTNYLTQEFATAPATTTRPAPRAPRPRSARQGELRAGQQPQPGPPEPARRGPGLPRPDASPTSTARPWRARCSTSSARGRRPSRPAPARSPGSTGKARTRGRSTAGPSRPPRWRRSPSRRPGRRRPSSTAAVRLAPGPSPGRRLAARTRPRAPAARRARRVLRQGGLGRGPLSTWSSPSTTPRSTAPTSSARPKARRCSSRARRSRSATRTASGSTSRGAGRTATR